MIIGHLALDGDFSEKSFGDVSRGISTRHPAWAHLPCGHLNLLGMLNFQLRIFLALLDILDKEREHARAIIAVHHNVVIPNEEKERFRSIINVIERDCVQHNLVRSRDRFVHFRNHIISNQKSSYNELLNQFDVLKEAIFDDIRAEYFYHYPADKVAVYLARSREWEAAIRKFPSIREEVDAATDCYALAYNTASVFHSMRIAEYGLRALARERSVTFPKHPLEWAEWQTILEQIEKRVRTAISSMSRGPSKDAASAFYSGALGQFHAFKDVYRNAVMHVRRNYDELDALRAINQVRDFMNGLSSKIGEKTRRPILRWP
jgi:hypothetical protein